MTRTNHTNRAGKALFLSDLVALSHRFLPETRPLKGAPAKLTPREQLWRTTKLRPEIVAVFDALADRHREITGEGITPSEIIAAALNLSLPVLVTRVFPVSGPEGVTDARR